MMDSAKEYAMEFSKMPDRFKKIYMSYIYCKAIDNPEMLRRIIRLGLPTDCESPIEQILWLALNIYTMENHMNYVFVEQQNFHTKDNIYRVDFLYCEDYMDDVENPFFLAIECDGHEFHEKTKEQVEKRNKRDMDLKMAGCDVLHYSGSQIYNNPFDCAREICEYITKTIEGKNNE